jgi:hypothetical protein
MSINAKDVLQHLKDESKWNLELHEHLNLSDDVKRVLLNARPQRRQLRVLPPL